jgi:predicted CXXCH cytochrome family protein
VKQQADLAHGHAPARKGECGSCHEPHQSAQRGLLRQKAGELCLSCHKGLAKRLAEGTAHAPVARGMCLTCHAPHGTANAGMLKREGGAMCAVCHDFKKPALAAKHPGMALEGTRCTTCHDPHVMGKNRQHLIRPFPHLPYARGECTSCHTARGAKALVASGKDLCLKCHDSAKAFANLPSQHSPVNGGLQCLSCHEPHAGQAVNVLKKGGDALCFECHDRALTEGKVKHAALEQGCTACHGPHGGDGPRLITEKDVADLCRTCHTDLTKHYHPTQSTRPDPRTGQPMRCTSCHRPHGSDLEGLLTHDPKRDLCIQCHDPSMAPPPKKR